MHPTSLGFAQFYNVSDASFKANSVGKKYVELACNVEIVDTILIYLSNWFSKGIPYELTPSGERIDDSELISLINKPNSFQSRQEFLAEFYYYLLAAGTTYIYPKSSNVIGFENILTGNELLNLNFDKVEEPLTNTSIFDFTGDIPLKYIEELSNGDQKKTDFNFNQVIPFFDSTNGIGTGLYKSKSRLETVRDEIKNIFLATKAKQNKIDLSGITLVTPEDKSGANSMSKGLDKVISTDKKGNITTHKDHIENKFKSSGLTKGRSIIVGSTELKAMNLTESLENIKFDPLRIEDARTIKRKLGVPENLLPLTDKGSTFENQEKEMLALLQSSIEPVAMNLGESISKRFKSPNKLMFDYTHLPAYSVIEKEKSEANQKIGEMIKGFVDSEIISAKDAKKILEEKGVL